MPWVDPRPIDLKQVPLYLIPFLGCSSNLLCLLTVFTSTGGDVTGPFCVGGPVGGWGSDIIVPTEPLGEVHEGVGRSV